MRALIADDEELARARVRRLLEQHEDVSVVGEATDGVEALRLARSVAADLIVLDVDMPAISGLDVANVLRDMPVVLVTAHAHCAAEAFDLDVVDFIVKPVTSERIARALQRVRRRLQHAPAPIEPVAGDGWRLSVIDGATVRLFDARALTRLFAAEKYTAFISEGREYWLRESLNDLEERLAVFGFQRVHRGELVRLDAIVAMDSVGDSAIATLRDGQRASVSRRYAATLRRRLGLR